MRRLIICTFLLSLPAWGAWIEIIEMLEDLDFETGRSPHGERGLKCLQSVFKIRMFSRSPHGERGLKCGIFCLLAFRPPVAPRMGSVD